MNKIYKVIWSKVKACYVVVSEVAKRHSKCKSAKPAISLAALVTAFMLTAGHGVVYATDLAPTDNVGKIGAITIDSSKVDDSKFSRIVNIDGFIIDNSVQNYGTFSQYMQNIYGRYNQVGTNRSDTLLGGWKSALAAVSVGNATNTRQITNLAAGTEDTDAVNVAQLKALNTKVDGGWTLAVARKTSTEGEATASGAAASVAPGAKVTLGAGRGIKLTQNGTNVDIGLKYIDMVRQVILSMMRKLAAAAVWPWDRTAWPTGTKGQQSVQIHMPGKMLLPAAPTLTRRGITQSL